MSKEDVVCPICGVINRQWPKLHEYDTDEELYRKWREDPQLCQHQIAHPEYDAEWREDLLAAFLKHQSWLFLRCGIDIEKYDRGELERHRTLFESIIREHIKEVDGFFFATFDDLLRVCFKICSVLRKPV